MFNRYTKKGAYIAALLLSFGFLQRNILLISQPRNILTHKNEIFFWHNIYIGFSYLINRVGIEDNSQKLYVKLSDTASSKSYNSFLKHKVILLFKKHPFVFLSTLFAKLGVMIFYFMLYGGWVLLLALFFCDIPFPVRFLCCSLLCMSSLPGILVFPEGAYIFDFKIVVILCTIFTIFWKRKFLLHKIKI